MANGVSDAGFSRKRLEEILTDKNAAVKSVLGDNLNLSPESPDGQINGVYSESDAALWELAEACYNAFAPSKASGNTLSDLVEINGITREPAIASTVTLTITGTNGTLIPAGSLVSTSDGSSEFATDANATISGGSISVAATSTSVGPVEATSGTLTVIESPITGWDTVNNASDAIVGQNEETDADLRARRKLSVARASKATVDTILAELLQVIGVQSAFIFENDTDVVDPTTGTPANSFQCVVQGGADADVASAIFNEKPVGISTFGSTTTGVLDSQGVNHNINYTRPTDVPIYVIVNLTTNSDYPPDGDDLIKQNIVDYTDGTLVAGRGFFVGDDIINSELYTPTNLILGHTIDNILIGIAPTPTLEDDIAIDFDEVSSFTIANITVNS
jgi:uncharacterized phage protein gp47/JayE